MRLALLLVLLIAACDVLPPPVAQGSLLYDGAPIAVSACTSKCTVDEPCVATMPAYERLESMTARVATGRLDVYASRDGKHFAYFDGDCVESHQEPYIDVFGREASSTVCDREDNVDFGACWTGRSAFVYPKTAGQETGAYSTIEAVFDCAAEGHTLTGTLTCKEGDYPK